MSQAAIQHTAADIKDEKAMSLTRVFISSLFALTLLAGCGKRGALYMPGDESSQQTAPEQQEQAAPAESTSGN